MGSPSPLPVAVRAYTLRQHEQPQVYSARRARWTPPRTVLVFDTETTTDQSQRLNFGSWRYYRVDWNGHLPSMACVEEGLFYADDLPERYPRGFQALRRYARDHAPAVDRSVPDAAWRMTFLSAREFTNDVLLRLAHRGRAWVVGFNLPFDLSRMAYDDSESQDYLAGGFSLTLSQYLTPEGEWKEHRWRSRVAIKTIDSKRRLMGFKRPREVDLADQIEEGGRNPNPARAFRGHFLDLRTLAFALTNESYSLERACKEFGVGARKATAERHGRINRRYIDYNRRDVAATGGLFATLVAEYGRHPIVLHPARAFSPASIGKDYLRGMGVRPRLERQPEFSPEVLGKGMVAYYGGRAECRIRRTPVPVVYVDFLSMYPTVNSLMELWDLVVAERVEPREGDEVTQEVQSLLDRLTLKRCFDPDEWPGFVGLVKIAPEGDVLPVRARYGHTESWGIGVNPLYLSENLRDKGVEGLWYTIPDAVAAKILTGRTPKVLDAIRFKPAGEKSADLRPIKLAGAVSVDPRRQDFFRAVIEERHRLRRNAELPPDERKRVDAFLKVLANSASYGIYAEMIRQELSGRRTERVAVYGAAEPFSDRVRWPESPGAFSFPPMAACITGAAKLMLAMLERLVTDQGGSFAFCDTDSMAVVATESGGEVPCPGGPIAGPDGARAVGALTWESVNAIRDRFAALNPL